MRVLQLIDTLDAGGAERMAINLANASLRTDFKAYICASRRGGLLETAIEKEIPFFVLNKRSFYDIHAIKKLTKIISENEIDILHAHSTSIYTGFVLKILRPKLKLIWHDHYGLSEFVHDRPLQKILKFISRYMSGIIACNEDLSIWSKKHLKCKKNIFLPNFVVENNRQKLVTKIHGVDGKRIVCLANLRAQKNHIGLLKIFVNLVKIHPDWTLHFVGKDFDDMISQEIKEFIAINNLSTSVFVYGSKNDTAAILKKMDIGVLTSRSEGLPLALLEYGLAGLAVMITNVGQCSQVVGKSGIIVNDLEKEGLHALVNLVENKKYRLKLGENFKVRIVNTYEEASSMKTLINFYKEIIK